MADTVFLLWHEYAIENREETKLLGIFTSRELAEENQKYFETQTGFKDHLNGFVIDETHVDKRLWSEGFISWNEALKALD